MACSHGGTMGTFKLGMRSRLVSASECSDIRWFTHSQMYRWSACRANFREEGIYGLAIVLPFETIRC